MARHTKPTQVDRSSAAPEVLDVAIVGAGMSGLYSAWRLLNDAPAAQPKPRITVFEGSHRVGGRLLSLTPPGMPNTRCELGGMRFMSRHVLVSALVQHFDIATTPMPVDEPGNIAYLRGQLLRQSDLASADKIPYHLRKVEQDLLAKNLLMYALAQIVPNCETLAGLDFAALQTEMQTASFDGTPLHELGFWNVLARVLSPDAYALVRDSGGYDCLVSNWSAADAIPFILADFGAGVSYSRFTDGFDRIPQRLAAEVQAAGGQLLLGACLRSFDVASDASGRPLVTLQFVDGRVVQARRLVLAMPRRSLELLEATGAVLDKAHQTVRALIESVEPIPLFKIFVCYPYPWWKAVGVSTGRALTDLPIRQCYYWGVEPKDAHTDGNAALLASYDDDLSVTFWAGLRSAGAPQSIWPPTPQQALQAEDWAGYTAPPAMLAEAHRQLVQMHGVAYAPQPYAAAYRDWADDPFGGGVNFWRIHARSWEVIPAIINPVPGLPVFICGEAYSHEQGWVEGALQTAELMLTSHFGLGPLPSAATRPAKAAKAAKPARQKAKAVAR
jgi:monoamine oxidase